MTYVRPDQIAPALTVIEGDWADPDWSLVEDGLLPPPPLPLDHFGQNWAGWLADFAASKSAPTDYAALALMAVAAATVGAARVVSPWAGWSEHGALWVLMVGDPSASKSPIYGPFFDILRELETEEQQAFEDVRRRFETDKRAAQESRALWEADVAKAVKADAPVPSKPQSADEPEDPGVPRIVVSDATVESLAPKFKANPRGLALWRDELAAWVGNFGKYGGDGEAAFFLERFTGKSVVVDRVKAGTIFAERGLLSVFGGIQPDRFHELLSRRADDGFVSRFLFAFPGRVERVRPHRQANLSMLSSALRRLRGLSFDQDEGKLKPKLVLLSPAALAVFEPWWQENGTAAAAAGGFMAGFLGKGAGVVLRLALLLELLEWCATPGRPEPSTVGQDAILAACGLYEDYFVPMAARVFGSASRRPEDMKAMRVIRYVRAKGEHLVNARELYRLRSLGLQSAAEAKAVLDILAEAGWARFEGGRDGARPGTQRGDWTINPSLFGGAR